MSNFWDFHKEIDEKAHERHETVFVLKGECRRNEIAKCRSIPNAMPAGATPRQGVPGDQLGDRALLWRDMVTVTLGERLGTRA